MPFACDTGSTMQSRRRAGESVGVDTARTPTVASYRMPGVSSAVQLIRFDAAGFAVSAGSACSSGSLRPSHVLEAMGLIRMRREVIRVSFGRETTEAEIDAFLRCLACHR